MKTLVKSTWLVVTTVILFILVLFMSDGWVIRNSLLSKIIEHSFPNNYWFLKIYQVSIFESMVMSVAIAIENELIRISFFNSIS